MGIVLLVVTGATGLLQACPAMAGTGRFCGGGGGVSTRRVLRLTLGRLRAPDRRVKLEGSTSAVLSVGTFEFHVRIPFEPANSARRLYTMRMW